MSPDKATKKDKGGKGKGKGKGKEGTKVAPAVVTTPRAAPKDRAHGPDWSGWDINDNSFKKMKGKGYKQGDFSIMKLTEGEIDDPQPAPELWVFKREADIRAEQWKQVTGAEIRGAFHYLRSGQAWQAQSNHFLEVAAEEQYDFHIYALDLEGRRNTYSDEFFGDARRIIDDWRVKSPGKVVMLYCNVSTYDDHMYPAMQRLFPEDGSQWLENVPLWLAQYDGKDTSGEGEPKTPKHRSKWDIWQYSQVGARDDFGARDLNVFNGSREALKVWLVKEAEKAWSEKGILKQA
jgi:hypothetical protein